MWWDCIFCGDQHRQNEACPYGGARPQGVDDRSRSGRASTPNN